MNCSRGFFLFLIGIQKHLLDETNVIYLQNSFVFHFQQFLIA